MLLCEITPGEIFETESKFEKGVKVQYFHPITLGETELCKCVMLVDGEERFIDGDEEVSSIDIIDIVNAAVGQAEVIAELNRRLHNNGLHTTTKDAL